MYGVAYSKISCLDHTLWSDVWQLHITGVEIIQRLSSNTTEYLLFNIQYIVRYRRWLCWPKHVVLNIK